MIEAARLRRSAHVPVIFWAGLANLCASFFKSRIGYTALFLSSLVVFAPSKESSNTSYLKSPFFSRRIQGMDAGGKRCS